MAKITPRKKAPQTPECPDCGLHNVRHRASDDTLRCVICGHRWSRPTTKKEEKEKEEILKIIQDYDEAILLNPQNALAFHIRGLTYETLGMSKEAEVDLAKAKELGYDPNFEGSTPPDAPLDLKEEGSQ